MKFTKIDNKGIWFEAYVGMDKYATHKIILKISDYTKLDFDVIFAEISPSHTKSLIDRKILKIISIESLIN